jgi:hypothetical protein
MESGIWLPTVLYPRAWIMAGQVAQGRWQSKPR